MKIPGRIATKNIITSVEVLEWILSSFRGISELESNYLEKAIETKYV